MTIAEHETNHEPRALGLTPMKPTLATELGYKP